MNKKIVGLGLATIAALSLVACGSRTAKKDTASSSDVKAAIITDIGGVDDRSFNQSAWEGLQEWGKDAGLSGYLYTLLKRIILFPLYRCRRF